MTEGIPIKPSEVVKVKAKQIPAFVIDIFNELIAKNFNGDYAVVNQCQVITLIVTRHDIDRGEIFKEKWLDIESIFGDAGWNVVYDKPAYCETYEASFKFTPKEAK